jgi:DNA repair protein RecO (recombination protein O)
LLESFLSAQSDYASGLALALMCEVTEAVQPEREASDPAFRLLLMAARRVRDLKEVWLPLAYFSLWTVRLGGWLPNLAVCGRCGRGLGGEAGFLAVARPGLLCGKCRLPGMQRLSAEELRLASQFLEQRLDQLPPGGPNAAHCRELCGYFLDVIEHQAERKLESRKLLESA